MRFTVIGAGAIGGVFGAFLARAGHHVTLVDVASDHVAAVRERGLQIEGYEAFTVHVPAMEPHEVRPPLGIVLLAVKAHHTLQALEPVAPLLAPDEFVVSLQNGLEEERIARVVGAERTVGAFLTLGAHYQAPGRIVYGGPATVRVGELDGRRSDRVKALADALSAVQPVEPTENIFGYLWGKLALGSVYFATALVDADVTDVLDRPRYRAVLEDLCAEIVAVADAAGVRVEAFDGFDPGALRFGGRHPDRAAACWAGQRRYWEAKVQRRTGVWRDLAVRRRKTEAEALLGAAIAHADRLGVPVERNRRLLQMILEIEQGARGMSWSNLDELADVAG